MTPLITLSIACASFIGGFAFGLMLLAIVRSHYDADDCGAPEGDQTSKFGQGSPS